MKPVAVLHRVDGGEGILEPRPVKVGIGIEPRTGLVVAEVLEPVRTPRVHAVFAEKVGNVFINLDRLLRLNPDVLG